MSCPDCTRLHDALTALAKINQELLQDIAIIRREQLEDRERLGVHGLWLEQHHHALRKIQTSVPKEERS